MDRTICCVCEETFEGELIEMGGRPYCTNCHAKVTRNRRGLWWTVLVQLLALLVFVGLVELVVGALQPQLQGTSLVVVGVALAVIPAMIWLAFFYAQDVREPEPKQLVLGVFLIGALLAISVGIPLIENTYRVSEWLGSSAVVNVLGSILVIGFVQQFLVYASVRYSVYLSAEFDERVDGVLYATAAALGYATMSNVHYVIGSGGVNLSAGVIRVVVTTMALGSFGGLIGYFLGRCKFEDEPLWWMPLGVAVAATLNGLFAYVRGEITTTRVGLTGGGFNPWPGLVFGAVVAAVTFAVLFALIRRLQRRAPQALGA